MVTALAATKSTRASPARQNAPAPKESWACQKRGGDNSTSEQYPSKTRFQDVGDEKFIGVGQTLTTGAAKYLMKR